MQLGFAKAHHQIPLEDWGFPFSISATAEASNFKFGTQLVLSKPVIKSHFAKKVMVALG